MAERAETQRLPRIVTITIVLVCASIAFWQWTVGTDQRSAQAQGTVTATEYVRRGSTANIAVISVSFLDKKAEQVIRYEASSSDLRIGDHVALRYNPNAPEAALPASEVALETSLHRSFAVFSALVGLIAVLAAVATRHEAEARASGRLASRRPIPAR